MSGLIKVFIKLMPLILIFQAFTALIAQMAM